MEIALKTTQFDNFMVSIPVLFSLSSFIRFYSDFLPLLNLMPFLSVMDSFDSVKCLNKKQEQYTSQSFFNFL